MLLNNLLDTEELCATAISHLSDGIFLLDRDGNILLWSGAAEKITGYSQAEITDQEGGLGILDPMDRAGVPLAGLPGDTDGPIVDGRYSISELFFRHKRGHRVPVLLRTTPIYEEDEIARVLGVFIDNSSHIQQNDLLSSLTKLILTDQLTGLSNKRHTEVLLSAKLDEVRQYGQKYSVLFINLDDFSACNERFGYEVGNRMLATMADNFRAAIRDTDFFGRWTGEEFVGVFRTKSPDHLKAVAEKIRALIEQTQIVHEGNPVRTTASIGATMACADDSVQQIIERAMSLMHVSKISGKNCATLG